MGKNRVEYAIRIGPRDRYRHLHIQERGKIVFFRVQYESKINRNRSRVQRFRGLGLFLAFFHPCLKIDMPSASQHSSLPASE
jgi:hypothetical protein